MTHDEARRAFVLEERMAIADGKVRVLIATTNGPVEVLLLTEEDPAIGRCVACIGGTTETADIAAAYHAFVVRPTGVIESRFRHPCYRLDVSARIDAGSSWQLGVLAAHALQAAKRLAQESDTADAVLWATGSVRPVDLTISAVSHVSEKLANSFDRLREERAAGRRVLVALPAANADDVPATLTGELAALGIETIALARAEPLFHALTLPFPEPVGFAAPAAASDPAAAARPPDVDAAGADHGTLHAGNLPPLQRSRSGRAMSVALRLAFLLMVGTVAFTGLQALLFPPDVLGRSRTEKIAFALQQKTPKLTPAQIDQFIRALENARGDPSFERAVEEAEKGNTRVAEGIWRQIYEDRKKLGEKAKKEQAQAARNLAASAVPNNVTQGLALFREATTLDPDNMDGWLGLGSAASLAGTLEESGRAFDRQISLARAAQDDRELALGLFGRGPVLIALGDLPGALQSYRDARALFERIIKAKPDDTAWQIRLAIVYDEVGNILTTQGKRTEALAAFHAGLAIRNRLSEADPGQRDLADSYNNIGNVLIKQGKPVEALASFRAGFAIIDRLAKSDPGDFGLQHDLAVSHGQIGDALVAQGHVPEALASFQAGLAISLRLAQADPGRTLWQRDLANAQDRVGQVLSAQDNLPEALKFFRDSLAVRKSLADADPGNTQFERDVSVSYNKIGDILNARGDVTAALASFRQSLAVAQRLAEVRPGNTEWQRDLCIAYDKVGVALIGQGQLPDALSSFRACLEIADRLVKADPADLQWQHDLAVTNNAIGGVLIDQGQSADGLRHLRAALAICERLVKADPDTAAWQVELANTLFWVGMLSDPAEKRTAFTRALSILEQLDQQGRLNTGQQKMPQAIRDLLTKLP